MLANLVMEVSLHSSPYNIQVVERCHDIIRQKIPEFPRKKDERVKILVNSCINEVNRGGVRVSRKHYVTRPCVDR